MKIRTSWFLLFLAATVIGGTGTRAQAPALREQSSPVIEEAHRLHLPLILSLPDTLGGQAFRLRRILHPDTSPGVTLEATGHNAQALYAGGKQTLSVFVSDVPQTGNAQLAPPSGGSGWKPLKLADGRIAFMHTTLRTPHSAVVWVGGGHRYTVIARLPLTKLVPLARTLARSSTLTVAAH